MNFSLAKALAVTIGASEGFTRADKAKNIGFQKTRRSTLEHRYIHPEGIYRRQPLRMQRTAIHWKTEEIAPARLKREICEWKEDGIDRSPPMGRVTKRPL
jgi:hypothetical protein